MLPRPPIEAALFVAIAIAPLWAQTQQDFDRDRVRMVSESIMKAGVTDPRVLEAMRHVPRHEFVPATYRSKAYWDSAWPIGYKQTITWPSVVALMTQSLEPQPEDKVLEIGTGSGYQAAVLSLLVNQVYSIEIVKPLGLQAEKRLKRLGYHNVKVKVGDGYAGWPEFAPFNKIIVTCSPEKVPQPLIDQLAEGGRMIIPIGSRYDQEMCLFEKRKAKLVRKQLMPTYFVPMTGQSDKDRTVKPDPVNPKIRNGGFEEREEDGQLASWYNQRQVTLVDTKEAPEGRSCVRFDNEEPGRRSNALQAIGVDGRKVAKLVFTLRCRTEHIVDGKESFEKAGLQVTFDDQRHFVGEEIATHVVGTSPWQQIKATVKVPEGARQAVVRIGLNGATGSLWIDDVVLTAERRASASPPE